MKIIYQMCKKLKHLLVIKLNLCSYSNAYGTNLVCCVNEWIMLSLLLWSVV